MFNNKFFRNMKHKLFGAPKTGTMFENERALLSDFDRFVTIVLNLSQQFEATLRVWDSLNELALLPRGLVDTRHSLSGYVHK